MVTLIAGEIFKAEVKSGPATTIVVQFAGPEQHSISATGTDGTFTVIADTTGWKPGFYVWEAWATSGDAKTLVVRRNFTLDPSAIDIIANTDVRSTARKAVENIQAMLAGGASIEARKYKINNRELERYSIPELLQLLLFWERKLAIEDRRARGVSSLGPRIEFRI